MQSEKKKMKFVMGQSWKKKELLIEGGQNDKEQNYNWGAKWKSKILILM